MVVVTAAIAQRNGMVLIARRLNKGRLPGKWEFPGGKAETGEGLEQCLKREIKEELDVEINIQGHFGTSIYEYPFGKIRLEAFSVEFISEEFDLKDHSEVRWICVQELGSYDLSPADLPFVESLKDSHR